MILTSHISLLVLFGHDSRKSEMRSHNLDTFLQMNDDFCISKGFYLSSIITKRKLKLWVQHRTARFQFLPFFCGHVSRSLETLIFMVADVPFVNINVQMSDDLSLIKQIFTIIVLVLTRLSFHPAETVAVGKVPSCSTSDSSSMMQCAPALTLFVDADKVTASAAIAASRKAEVSTVGLC